MERGGFQEDGEVPAGERYSGWAFEAEVVYHLLERMGVRLTVVLVEIHLYHDYSQNLLLRDPRYDLHTQLFYDTPEEYFCS